MSVITLTTFDSLQGQRFQSVLEHSASEDTHGYLRGLCKAKCKTAAATFTALLVALLLCDHFDRSALLPQREQ